MMMKTILLLLYLLLLILMTCMPSSFAIITYDDVKDKLLKCKCFNNILKEIEIDQTPKGISTKAFHSVLDDVIAKYVNQQNMMKRAKLEQENIKIGFAWDASEFADDPPPNDISITDLNLDDTREFIKKYDLPITISMKDGRSKEDIVRDIERAVRIARKERINAYLGAPRNEDNVVEIKYIIIGAGPAGMQQAYFLERENRDYIVFEKETKPGSFFTKYPRSRRLNSLNRKFIYGANENDEMAFRYDGNSLLSDDYNLKFTKYSYSKYPHADIYHEYLQHYAEKTHLKIKYSSKVISIKRQHRIWNGGITSMKKKNLFLVTLSNGEKYRCRVLIVASGLQPINLIMNDRGIQQSITKYSDTYDTVSFDSRNYYKRRVLLFGNNKYFRNEILSQSMLYSSVSILNTNGRDMKNAYVNISETSKGTYNISVYKTSKKKIKKRKHIIKHGEFDDIILCNHFEVDISIFVSNRTKPKIVNIENTNIIKYSYDFSSNVSHMFFAGALIQYPPHLYNRNAPYLNIGQWRYLSRALHRFLEVKYEQRTWPSIRKIPAHASGIVDRIKYRIQQAAGLYQMYTNHEEVINRNINNGLADLITLPLSGYFANSIRRGNTLYLPEVHGLPNSAASVLLKIKKFHNKDMLLVRHFMTLSFDINKKPLNCNNNDNKGKKQQTNITNGTINRNTLSCHNDDKNYERDCEMEDCFRNIHPRINLYALPMNTTSRRLISGKSQLLRVFHFDNKNMNIDFDLFNFWSSIDQMDLLQNWIERIAFRVVSSGHLLPPQIAKPPLEKNECQV